MPEGLVLRIEIFHMKTSPECTMQDIIRLKAGDVAAFDIIYEQYHNAVYANIYKMVKRQEFAEDILQEVFLSLWENKDKIKSDQSVGGWLFVVSFNKAASFLQKKINTSMTYVAGYESFDSLSAEPAIDESAYATQYAILKEAIETLSPRKKEVFNLCRFEGHSVQEAANILGVSPESVKDYLKQSTKLIKAYISSNYPQVIGIGLILMYC